MKSNGDPVYTSIEINIADVISERSRSYWNRNPQLLVATRL